MTKKYLVLPGYVFSQNDGDEHFIGATQLMDLYGVDPRECVIGESRPGYDWAVVPSGIREEDYIKLEPRYDGDYRLEVVGA